MSDADSDSTLPEGWKMVCVGDILKLLRKADQRRVITELKSRRHGTDEKVKFLKELLLKYKDTLEKAGHDPDFLAYALVHAMEHPRPPKTPDKTNHN